MAASPDSAPSLVLHIWPPHEAALSIDPECVSALLYLQLSVPGQYSIVYCNNPDLSPSGRLPYLTHGLYNVASFSSIVKYVAQLEEARPLDAHMSDVEKAQMSASVAHVEAQFGDLVAHVYYALSANWVGKMHPMFVSILPVPQRYFLPKRIRDSYKLRLEAAEMWNAKGVEEEEEEERQHWTLRRLAKKNKKASAAKKHRHVYAREKVLGKARILFDIYARLLGGNAFIYQGDTPTVLDVILAAHLHLLLQPVPDPLIRDLLSNSYPQLVAYSKSICQVAFPDPLAFPPVTTPSKSFSFSSMISVPRFWRSAPRAQRKTDPEVAQTVRQFKYLRWGFFAAVATTIGLYLRFGNIVLQSAIFFSQDSPQLRELKDALAQRTGVKIEAMAENEEETEGEADDGASGEEED